MAIENRVVILTALSLEADAVRGHIETWQPEYHPKGTIYERGTFGSKEVLLGVVGAGNVAAAQETERAINHFDPQLVLFVGVAGGLKDVELGDVVAATKVYAYESGVDRDTFLTRPEIGLSSYPLVQQARAVSRQSLWYSRIMPSPSVSPKVYVGALAAGEKVVKSSEGAVASFLRQHYGDALAVEMEGAGFLRAAYASSVDALVVRGISDLLDGKEYEDGSGSQERASSHAAAFAFEVLAALDNTFSTAKIPNLSASNPERWPRLRECVSRLYPTGPLEKGVWSDAGGDISRLDLQGDGRTQWARAIRRIENGGDVSFDALVGRMHQDFPNNMELKSLIDH